VLLRIHPFPWERENDCVKYPIFQYVCTGNLSNGIWSFIDAIDVNKIPSLVQEVIKSEHWTQSCEREDEC